MELELNEELMEKVKPFKQLASCYSEDGSNISYVRMRSCIIYNITNTTSNSNRLCYLRHRIYIYRIYVPNDKLQRMHTTRLKA